MKYNSKVMLFTFCLLNLIFTFLLININYRFMPNNILLISISSSLIILSISIFSSFKLYNAMEYQNLNYKALSTQYDSLRAFKHDYSNIIQAIGGYIALNDMPGLKKYYKSLGKECKEIDNLSIINPNIINNPALYKTLSAKYYKAKDKNISFNLSICSDLSNMSINDFDLNRVIGILLDNSIESASECKEKIINVNIFNKPYSKIIKIENTLKDKNIELNNIYKKYYSTKKNNSGIGLWEISRILNKYTDLDLKTYVENDLFTQELEIPVYSKEKCTI